MARIAQLTLDVRDVRRMADFWSALLGLGVERDHDGNVHLRAHQGDASVGMWLQPTTSNKLGKNRCHPDLAVESDDVEAEVERALSLGAHRANVGQIGDEGFVVLRDPEGNEFCILRSQPPKDD
jgi:predicted enzyme related to lactoylglutathione lyase